MTETPQDATPAPSVFSAERPWLVCLAISAGLFVAVLIVYAQTAWFEFVNYDDNFYIYDNTQVQKGLTKENVKWAFTSVHHANWHPLTTLSNLFDVELHGLRSGWHHLGNVFLHAATAVVLFLAWCRLTGALWPSAFVAALFALHPLRVESVAWVSERKDVLSGLFFALTLFAYAGYARRPAIARYVLVALMLALGLLSKSMLVTVPFVLLLLDYWPLRRKRSLGWLIIEKLPLLALAVMTGIKTVWAQQVALEAAEYYSLKVRLENAVVSYVIYLRQFFWPFDLSFFYPHPRDSRPGWQAPASIALLLAISFLVFRARRQRPYLIAGWLWYLGMLTPVIGIVPVGGQAHADRYTYLPQIGLAVMLTWWVKEFASACRCRPGALAVGAAVLLLALNVRTWQQTQFWHDNVSLYSHALNCTENNDVAHNNLGGALMSLGKPDEAARHFHRALSISPNNSSMTYNYGLALCDLGRPEEGVVYLQRSVELKPKNLGGWRGLGDGLRELGAARAHQGRFDEAIDCFHRAVDSFRHIIDADPQQAREINFALGGAHADLATALYFLNRHTEALTAYRESLRLRPNHLITLKSAARLAATSPDPEARSKNEAIQWADRAVRITDGQDFVAFDTVAAAFAEAGRFEEAIVYAERAIELAYEQNQVFAASTIRKHQEGYQNRQPLREPVGKKK